MLKYASHLKKKKKKVKPVCSDDNYSHFREEQRKKKTVKITNIVFGLPTVHNSCTCDSNP